MPGFLESESGAVTTDWVVLTAALVGLGVGTAGAVRTGTSALATDINTSLTSAVVGGGLLLLDGFSYVQHTGAQWNGMIAAFAERTDEDLVRYANGQSNGFSNELAAGNLDRAEFWAERRYVSEHYMRDRGLTDTYGALSYSEMQGLLAAARAESGG